MSKFGIEDVSNQALFVTEAILGDTCGGRVGCQLRGIAFQVERIVSHPCLYPPGNTGKTLSGSSRVITTIIRCHISATMELKYRDICSSWGTRDWERIRLHAWLNISVEERGD